jgi:hypothetical protein
MLPIAISIAIVFCQAIAPSSADSPKNPADPVSLSNTEFRLPPNSHWREERIMSAPKLKLLVDLGTEKNIKGTMSMQSRQILDVDVLSATDLRLRFVQNDTTSDVDFGDKRSRQTTTLPLDGKSVLAQRGESGRWSAKLDGRRRPTGEESSALHGLTYLWSEGIYPDREVAIGESWKVDAKDLKNLFGADFIKPEGEFEFTLARIVEHEGHECAKIIGRGKFKSQSKSLGSGVPGAEETPLDAAMDLTVEIYHSTKLAADLAVKMKGTLELSNEKDQDALTFRASSPIEFNRTLRKR